MERMRYCNRRPTTMMCKVVSSFFGPLAIRFDRVEAARTRKAFSFETTSMVVGWHERECFEKWSWDNLRLLQIHVYFVDSNILPFNRTESCLIVDRDFTNGDYCLRFDCLDRLTTICQLSSFLYFFSQKGSKMNFLQIFFKTENKKKICYVTSIEEMCCAFSVSSTSCPRKSSSSIGHNSSLSNTRGNNFQRILSQLPGSRDYFIDATSPK